jgi:D-xylose transport system permease protein
MGVGVEAMQKSGKPVEQAPVPFIVRIRAYMMVMALIVLWVLFGALTNGTYLSSRNMSLLLRQVSIVGIASIGMVMMLIMAQIDLSVGSTFALFAGIAAILEAYHGWDTLPVILLCLGGGLLVGAIHGVIVGWLNRPFAAFPVTLGGWMAWRGLENLLSGGIVVSPINPSHEFLGSGYLSKPLSFALLGATALVFVVALLRTAIVQKRQEHAISRKRLIGRLAVIVLFALFMAYVISFHGMPVPVLITLVLGGLFHFITQKTSFGRRLYAIGGNREAAHFSGINIRRNTILAFLLMGLLSAIGGLVFVGRLGVAEPQMGTYLEMDAIAACVIGGAALLGGQGTVLGALLGAFVIGSLDNGMSVLAVSSFWRFVVKGLVLVAVVYIDITAKRLQK